MTDAFGDRYRYLSPYVNSWLSPYVNSWPFGRYHTCPLFSTTGDRYRYLSPILSLVARPAASAPSAPPRAPNRAAGRSEPLDTIGGFSH